MTQQTNEPLHSETLKFLGRRLKKEGTSKEGREWKLYKLEFDTGGQYPWGCSAFNSISDKGVQPKDLEEGKFYKILYKVQSFQSQYGPQKSKQAVLIQTATEEQATNPLAKKQQQQQQQLIQPETVSTDGFDTFAQEYKQKMGNQGNAMHMLAAYVVNHHADQFSQVIKKCQGHFPKKEE